MNIILCEPQCIGFEHAAFNAALLATVGEAYQRADIHFFGEASHLREVEGILTSIQASPTRVNWQPTTIPSPRPGGLRRLTAERKLIDTVLAQAGSSNAHNVLFSSANEMTILALKKALRSTPPPYGVQVVLHGVLRSLIEPRWRKPWRWGFSLRQAWRTPHPPGLGYIALSESIRANAVREVPSLGNTMHAMDMPRLWGQGSGVVERKPLSPTRFGFFGSTAKGFKAFYEMASTSKAAGHAAQFSLIGFLNGRDLQQDYSEEVVEGLSRQPISQEEYSRRASEVDYAVWPANPAHYSLTASASFLDALDYQKPVIYLANAYIDAYAERIGDMGYRCETLGEMQAVIEGLAKAFPEERYRKLCGAMREGRRFFEPRTVAPVLKQIMEDAPR